MKLPARDLKAFAARPDPNCPALLIYGADAMRVALKRKDLVTTLLGPNGAEEMRLERIEPSDLRKDPAHLNDVMKATGFFPGQRVVLAEEVNDQAFEACKTSLTDWQSGDAILVVTAGALKPSSKLRKLFEGHKTAKCTAIYDDPPGRGEIEDMLKKAGAGAMDRGAMDALLTLARVLDPGDLQQLIEKAAVYKLGDATPLTEEELELLAPATTDAAIDDVIHAVAEGRSNEIGPLMQRLTGQGVNAVTLVITAGRHFRTLHSASSHPQGAATGIAAARPPVFGPRRDRMLRQTQNWGMHKLEAGLQAILSTDMQLRSAGQSAPQMALVERMFIRLAMMGRR